MQKNNIIICKCLYINENMGLFKIINLVNHINHICLAYLQLLIKFH